MLTDCYLVPLLKQELLAGDVRPALNAHRPLAATNDEQAIGALDRARRLVRLALRIAGDVGVDLLRKNLVLRRMSRHIQILESGAHDVRHIRARSRFLELIENRIDGGSDHFRFGFRLGNEIVQVSRELGKRGMDVRGAFGAANDIGSEIDIHDVFLRVLLFSFGVELARQSILFCDCHMSIVAVLVPSRGTGDILELWATHGNDEVSWLIGGGTDAHACGTYFSSSFAISMK